MISIHVSGRLVRDPAQKTSANGNAYTTALLLAATKDAEQLVSLSVFDTDLQTLLASLKKDDGISVMGGASIRAYVGKDGAPQAGVSVMVNRLMALAEGKAKPRPKEGIPPRRSAELQSAGPREFAPDFNDELPPF